MAKQQKNMKMQKADTSQQQQSWELQDWMNGNKIGVPIVNLIQTGLVAGWSQPTYQ